MPIKISQTRFKKRIWIWDPVTIAIVEPQHGLHKLENDFQKLRSNFNHPKIYIWIEDRAHLSNPLSSSADLFAAMAQMRTPKTAFATKSATEYPTCSYVVAVLPARPKFLTMYTQG